MKIYSKFKLPELSSLCIGILIVIFSTTGCAKNTQPQIDVDYEARLIEYEACVQASTTKWQELAPDLQTDALLGIVKKECEKYRP